MSDGVNSSYLSDSAILAWVTEQQQRLYGDLHGAMDFVELRAGMAADAADIKQLMAEASDPTKLRELQQQLHAFAEKYGSFPEFAEVMETIGPITEQVNAKVAEYDDYDAKYAEYERGGAASESGNVEAGGQRDGDYPADHAPAPPENVAALAKDALDDLAATLDSKIDGSNNNEQIGMIHINEIKSNIDQSTQLASQLIKTSNDASAVVINNLA